MTDFNRTTFFLDQSRFEKNISFFSKYHPLEKITPVLKANAYGHGIDTILNLIQDRFETIAVATLSEAAPYISNNFSFKILHGPLSVNELDYDDKVLFVIGTKEQLKMICHLQRPSYKRYWLKIDLGLNRLGFTLSEARELLLSMPHAWAGLLGHLGAVQTYPELSAHQALQLKQLASEFSLPLSLENTEGFTKWYQKPFGDYIRLGLAFYGYSKDPTLPVFPVGRLCSKIMKRFPACAKLMGYDWTHRFTKPVSLVSVGYGDGLSPHLTGYELGSQIFKVGSPMMMDLCYLEELKPHSSDSMVWFGETREELLNISQYLKVKPYVVLSQLNNRIHRVINYNHSHIKNKEAVL